MEKVSWILAVSLLSIATLLAVVLPFVLIHHTTTSQPFKSTISNKTRPVMSDSLASFLYKMTHDFKTIAEEHNLHYWIIGGTLIGALRHQGFIPWDDDIDIAIKSSDRDLFVQLEERFKKLGYFYQKVNFGYKILAKDMPEPNWIDIFIYTQDGDHFVLEDQSARRTWPKDTYTVESVKNRVLYKFGNDYLYGPGHAVEFLNRAYDTNWNHEGKFWNLHTDTSPEEKKLQRWVLQQHEYQPGGKNTLTYH